MAVNPGGRRLRQWLIEQINSNSYPGLLWEDESRTMFRIPWKHAGKQDYNQEVDASIFKAWAMFKGKFKEGDKAEPATWKTRLRCALNKSPDFEEVTDRSQLDISEPYKVYRIIPEEEQKCKTTGMLHGNPSEVTDMDCSSTEVEDFVKESSKEDYVSNIKMSPLRSQDSSRIQSTLGLQVHLQAGSIDPAFSALTIHFFYGGKMAGSVLCTHPEGCRISPQQMPVLNEGTPNPNSMQSVGFPPIEVVEGERQRQVTRKLFGHLERGVLLRASREGIFIKRLCQSRVFWSGLYSQYSPGPCKLERDAIVKIFDTSRFLQALQLFHDGQYLAPDPTITLCFGEEFHDVNSTKSKLIIVQIIPTHWQQLVDTHSSRRLVQLGPNLDLSEEIQNEQIANIFHELCSYTVPHPCYWENQPITV